MQEPTDRQREVVSTIKRLTHDRGFPPTVRELAQALKVSINGVTGHLAALKRKGLVTWMANKARSIVLTARAKEL